MPIKWFLSFFIFIRDINIYMYLETKTKKDHENLEAKHLIYWKKKYFLFLSTDASLTMKTKSENLRIKRVEFFDVIRFNYIQTTKNLTR